MALRGAGSFDGLYSPVATGIGNLSWSGTVILTEDVYADTLTLANSTDVRMDGFAIFCRNNLILGDNVAFEDYYNAPSYKAGIDSSSGGAAGVNSPSGTVGGSWYSGGAGSVNTGGQATGLVPSTGIHLGGGGGGGGGGFSFAGGSGARLGYDGGGGGSSGNGNGSIGALNHPEIFGSLQAKSGYSVNLSAMLTGCVTILGVNYPIYGGNGGGGGGGDTAHTGGGGGAGAGVVRIMANRISRSGSGSAPTINANGGLGGAGHLLNNGGGGGGGGGGVIMIAYGSIDPTITFNVNGGLGGTSSGGGGTGANGSSGRIFKFEL